MSERCPLCATATVFDECTVGLQYAWKKLNKKLKVFEIVDKCSAVAEMGDRLPTIDMGRKEGGGLLCPFHGELGPRLI